MTSRIRFVVETVENRGKTVWLVGVNRKETVNQPYTGQSHAVDHGTLVVLGSQTPGLSRGSNHYFTTYPRFTESLAGTSMDTLVQGLSTPRPSRPTIPRSVC